MKIFDTTLRRPRRRFQYRLVSLFALMTVACLGLSWYVWPKSVEVVATVMASSTTVAPTGRTVPEPRFRDYQDKLMETLADPAILQDGVAIAGNGKLAMLRGRSDPVDWVRRRLDVTASPNSLITIKLTVPERHQRDAVEFVDYILFRAVTQTARGISDLPRSALPEAIKRRQSLELSLQATSRRWKQARLDYGPNSLEAAAIEAQLYAEQESWQRLHVSISDCELIEDFMDQLRFVQTATVTGEPRKMLFF
jgi:hypothetical protein